MGEDTEVEGNTCEKLVINYLAKNGAFKDCADLKVGDEINYYRDNGYLETVMLA
jgi:hypothetical protein